MSTPSNKETPKKTIMTRAIQPRELNQADVLAGGFLMTWMDEIAGITSQRYAGPPVTTVGMTDIKLREPIRKGDILEICGTVVKAGRTSVTVLVTATVDGKSEPSAEGLFTYVAVDEDGKPRAYCQS